MRNGYAAIGGLQLYYEIHGDSAHESLPLVLLHGGGSTIDSTFGRILPELARSHQLIALESQAHGRTKDIDRPLTFEQDADDVAALLRHLKIEKVNAMGFSNGGMTALQLAIRHPKLVNRLIVASAPYKRDGMPPGFFEGLERASLDDMPKPLQEAFLKLNPDRKALQAMFDRDRARMLAFKDFPDSDIRAIQAPVLVLNGDSDVILPEHALQLSRVLPHAHLAILPGGHGEYIGEICAPDTGSKIPELVVALIDEFLNARAGLWS